MTSTFTLECCAFSALSVVVGFHSSMFSNRITHVCFLLAVAQALFKYSFTSSNGADTAINVDVLQVGSAGSIWFQSNGLTKEASISVGI